MRTARGFTLLEVLVALAILGVVMLALMRLLVVDSATAIALEDRLAAEIVADNAAVETMIDLQPPDLGIERGSEILDGREWLWTRTTVESGVESLVRIDIAVRKPDGEQTIASRTLLRRTVQ
ncbi:MAG: type II secretion system minor pseudopilin GspI [Pseudomonadota bacterium]